jgi:predicted ATP-grasp superfamily ATP-dependent carboligase
MAKLKSSKGTVLVTDCGRGAAVSIIRSLGRCGWQVVAADSDPRSLGYRSRYATHRLVYPTPAASPQQFVEAIAEAVERYQVDLIIPVTDSTILPLSEARKTLEGKCQLALPQADALEATTNKMKTVQLAERLGVPVPATKLVHTAEEAERQADTFDWPIVLKPMMSRVYRDRTAIESFTVGYADTPARLVQMVRALEGRCGVLLQQYVAGRGVGVDLLLDNGRPLAAFQHRRVREYPFTGGVSACCESTDLDPQLYEYAVRLMGALTWTGLAMVEFKMGTAGPMLMEINGRVWGSLPLAIQSGVDFPARLSELYVNGSPPWNGGPDAGYVVGTRGGNLELELKWIASVLFCRRRYPFLTSPSRREALGAGLSWLNPHYRFDLQSADDPLPGLAEVPKILRDLWQRIRQPEKVERQEHTVGNVKCSGERTRRQCLPC